MKCESKGNVAVFVLGGLTLLFALLAGYFYLQTQNNVSSIPYPVSNIDQKNQTDASRDWKTYTNTAHNYQFDYPENLYSTDCNNQNLLLLHSEAIPSCIDISGGELVFGVVGRDGVGLSDNFTIGHTLLLQEKSPGKGIRKYYLESEYPNSQPSAFAIYKVDLKNGFLIDVIVFNRENEEISDQILSTFRFTN